jgi:mannose-1-phosphate guanylyltransferase
MRALLLCAGLGTRLRPITATVPKCLVPIRGRPLLDYWLDSLVDGGVERILINTHYLAERVADHVRHSQWSERATIVYEPTLLGTGGTILSNRAFFADRPFLVAHADNLSTIDIAAFMRAHLHRSPGTDMTMAVFYTDQPQSCGIVRLDPEGRVIEFHEKSANPPGNLANGAVYIFEPEAIDQLERLGKPIVDLSTEVIPTYLGRIQSYQIAGYHRDIGTVESLNRAEVEFPSTVMRRAR